MGEIRPPARVAIGYRLSSRQYLGEGPGRWLPHVRVYAPFLTNEQVGGDRRLFRHPFVFGREGGPFAYLVVVVPDEFDPTR